MSHNPTFRNHPRWWAQFISVFYAFIHGFLVMILLISVVASMPSIILITNYLLGVTTSSEESAVIYKRFSDLFTIQFVTVFALLIFKSAVGFTFHDIWVERSRTLNTDKRFGSVMFSLKILSLLELLSLLTVVSSGHSSSGSGQMTMTLVSAIDVSIYIFFRHTFYSHIPSDEAVAAAAGGGGKKLFYR